MITPDGHHTAHTPHPIAQLHGATSVLHPATDGQLAPHSAIDDHGRPAGQLPGENLACKGILEALLDRAFQRASAILGVPTGLGEDVFGGIRHLKGEVASLWARRKASEVKL